MFFLIHTGGEFEPEIVTELPKEIFKKSKLKNYSAGLKKSEGIKSFNPISSDEKTNIPIISQGTGKLCSSKVSHNEIFAANKPMRKLQTETAQRSSKWTEYLTHDDDELLFKGGDDSLDPLPQWRQTGLEIQLDDQRVEEDVQPDFI
ncbi:hypothetical protein BVC80_9041g7 [Macleaya cordata]|uniref:Uncharacterized protein n=1 Tax=Macleaya cordata TaxID=56857 RepID=A0A200R2R6_MACCD|nr:hypothetical protein BVC80_9041g7 [Macleaya cordata]